MCHRPVGIKLNCCISFAQSHITAVSFSGIQSCLRAITMW